MKTNSYSSPKELLSLMTIEEKIGQMAQIHHEGGLTEDLSALLAKGAIGSILNVIEPEHIQEIQQFAKSHSRLGIPILMARDIIHGFHTMMPIPLGQAASWDTEVIEKGARVAAVESSRNGLHWTFTPMIDICRDPRWGRIAESLGEDPFLTKILGAAMVKGFQGLDLKTEDTIAACAKHFAAYGYSEAGRDYDFVNISESELRNVVLPPFQYLAEKGVATMMTGFSDINGIPASAHQFLLRKILREEWSYEGMVVSDFESIREMIVHGFVENEKEAAFESITAGVDMEMVSTCYRDTLKKLVEENRVSENLLDQAVLRILKLKFDLGLFDENSKSSSKPINYDEHKSVALEVAEKSIVLLKNNGLLPLSEKHSTIGIIGPLAEEPHEQMGTWTFDGKKDWVETPLHAFKAWEKDKNVSILYAKGLSHSRSMTIAGFEEALTVAESSDIVICFMGEEAILSGEAHSRAHLDLPGLQTELLQKIKSLGKAIVLVTMAGRPLCIRKEIELADAVLYAWHPGTMGGPAILNVLFGNKNPEGKLPVSFPKSVGQIPIYYAKRNSGRPANKENFTSMNEIAVYAPQTSLGHVAMHLDEGFEPLFPFGFGLSYTQFEYHSIRLEQSSYALGEDIRISCKIKNLGEREGIETVQVYVRDLVGSITRPVKELKAFKKVQLKAQEEKEIAFVIPQEELGFYGRDQSFHVEPGDFKIGIGGDSNIELETSFSILSKEKSKLI